LTESRCASPLQPQRQKAQSQSLALFPSFSWSPVGDPIFVSGGYEDDENYGDEIIYTGQGGNDPETKKQVADQPWTRGNLALVRSQNLGLPIRVARGANPDSEYAPATGYRYDGLYRVDEHWQEEGKSGFTICRFRLNKTTDDTPGSGDDSSPEPAGNKGPSRRVETTTLRIIRDTKIGRTVKELHGYKCQICGITLQGI
jgi:putative restriction endonuclease